MRNKQGGDQRAFSVIAGDVELKTTLDLLRSCCKITPSTTAINVCETNGLLIDWIIFYAFLFVCLFATALAVQWTEICFCFSWALLFASRFVSLSCFFFWWWQQEIWLGADWVAVLCRHEQSSSLCLKAILSPSSSDSLIRSFVKAFPSLKYFATVISDIDWAFKTNNANWKLNAQASKR